MDKLGIFVSSTIQECVAERTVARRAVVSINHRPILFEGVGARPHPPRQVYLSMIDEAKIFVGIYKASYGWIAPGGTISGLEDEFWEARSRGLPMFIYIHADATNREDRLTGLLEEFTKLAEFKYARFSLADELYSLIRDDVTAAVADHFSPFPPISKETADDPARILMTIPDSGLSEIVREDIIKEIDSDLSNGSVCVLGPMGSGKSILLAQIAVRGKHLYANCRNMSGKDALAKCAAILREYVGGQMRACTDSDAAMAELREAATAAGQFTLIVDDFSQPELLLEAIREPSGRPSGRLCFSARTAPASYGGPSVLVRPLSEGELRQLAPRATVDLGQLMSRSAGNPLYVRYFVHGGEQYLDSLASYELRTLTRIPVKARELCTFVAIARSALSLDDLMPLLAADGAEHVIELSRQCEGLVSSTPAGYVVFHDHLRDTIRSDVEADASRRSYYAGRLAQHYSERHQFLEVFELLELAQSSTAVKYAARAAFDAQVRGEIRRARKVLIRQIEFARTAGSARGEARVLLALSKVEEIAGSPEESRATLTRAAEIAKQLNDTELAGFVEEREIVLEALCGGGPAAIQRLEALRDAYAAKGEDWNIGRLSLELSVIWIRNADYVSGAKDSLKAFECFERTRDTYGAHLAERNLASAYIASTDKSLNEKGAELLAKIASEHAEDSSPRQRAWMLNLRTRQARAQGRADVAVTLATEAIAIGEELGDASVIINNRVNLGNALIDLARPEDALKSYEVAASVAERANDVRGEAHSTRLIASAWNALKKPAEARLAALQAISKARACADSYVQAQGYEELGEAFIALGDESKAGNAYFDAALALADDAAEIEYFSFFAFHGMRLLSLEREWRELAYRVDALFETPESVDQRREDLLSFEVDVQRALAVARQIAPNRALGCQASLGRSMFRGMTPRMKGAVVLAIARALLNKELPDARRAPAILSVAALVTFVEPEALPPAALVELAQLLAGADPEIHFRPMGDGAASWLVRLDWGTTILCAVRQLDDRPDTFVATWLIVALLKCFQSRLREEILLDPGQLGREMSVWVANETEVAQLIPAALPMLGGALQETSAVTRPTAFDGDLIPTFVICRGDIASGWSFGASEPHALHLLFGQLILELLYVLYAGRIDLEMLQPKVAAFVARALQS
jgi:tetratricopeptide (TPR) repeat protein